MGPAPGSGAEHTGLCVPLPRFPPCTSEAEGTFFRTLKWPLKVPLAAAQEGLERQAEGSGSPK